MLVLAHRGASVAAAENSPEAFALADAMGADGVELDVRRAPDGRLLVAHDPLPDSLVAIDALGAATFAEVLDACGDRMLVNVEIKNWRTDSFHDPTMALVPPILDELRRRGPSATHRWLISSFSWSTVAACREYAPEFATACLTSGPVDDETVARLAAIGHRALHPWEGELDETLVSACHRHGLAVNTWTCNDPARLVELRDMGVDGVHTDVPDIARRALGRADVAVRPTWSAPAG